MRTSVTIRVSDNDFNFSRATRLRLCGSETFLNTGQGDRFVAKVYLDPTNAPFGQGHPGSEHRRSPHDPALCDDLPISLSQNPGPARLPAPDGPFGITGQVEVALGDGDRRG